MRRIAVLTLCLIFILGLCSCAQSDHSSEEVPQVTQNEDLPEEVRIVQRKIDKALESTPSYHDLTEIRDLYDDLLIEEQKLIQNYDKIEEMLSLSSTDVAAIYAANELKKRLKNPSSLNLLSVGAVFSDTSVAIKFDYSATNNIGGNVDDEFYCLVDVPTYDSETDQWFCQLNFDYSMRLLSEIISGMTVNTSQDLAREEYEDGEVISIDPEKVMDNISLSIEDGCVHDVHLER